MGQIQVEGFRDSVLFNPEMVTAEPVNLYPCMTRRSKEYLNVSQ